MAEKPSLILETEEVNETEVVASPTPTSSAADSPVMPTKSEDTWSKFPPQIDTAIPPAPKSRLFVPIIVLLVAAAVIVLGLVAKKFLSTTDSSITESQIDALPTPTDAPVPTATPTPEITSKDKVKIQVLNASGVAGQAGKIALDLEKLEFPTPDAKNYDGDNILVTQVNYSPRVSTEIVDEVVTLLKKSFDTVEPKLDSTLTDFDIQIITGTDEEE